MLSKVQDAILKEVRDLPAGAVFSAKDMAAHGFRDAVDQALHRLAAAGTIRRIHWGLYEKPKFSKLLGGTLSPSLDKVAHALARKFNWHIQPTGSATLNELGLSTQVPARHVYLSSGPTKRYKIGSTTIDFQHVASKDLDFRSNDSTRLVQALKALGDQPLDDAILGRLNLLLAGTKGDRLLMETRSVTSWVHDRLKQLNKVA